MNIIELLSPTKIDWALALYSGAAISGMTIEQSK